jgi:hypothetical protein
MNFCPIRATRSLARPHPSADLALRELRRPSAAPGFELELRVEFALGIPLHPRLRILPLLHPPAHLGCFLSLQLAQMLGRLPARVRAHLVPAPRGGGVPGQPGLHFSGLAANFWLGRPGQTLRTERARFEWVQAPLRPEPAPISLLRRARNLSTIQALVPHQNMPAVKAEEPVGRKPLRVSFCAPANGRASIYACKAFNTEERAGSNAGASG